MTTFIAILLCVIVFLLYSILYNIVEYINFKAITERKILSLLNKLNDKI